jgi:APA family basic amino acid/polyamine antiporter
MPASSGATPPRPPAEPLDPEEGLPLEPEHGLGKLRAILGLGFGLAGAVGGTIGAGILRTPGLVAAQLGSPLLIALAWGIGGIYALLGALCVAELGTSLPLAGGWYVYARRAFGDPAGLTVGWVDWLGHCAALAWVAITIGEYGRDLLPSLPLGPRTLSLLAIALFTAIQLLGLRAGSGSQQLLSLAKAIAFLALVAACFLLHGEDPLAGATTAAPVEGVPSGWNLPLALALALQPVVSTYDGWHSPIYFAEEFQRPDRELPRSLLGGVLAVTAIYLLLNLALLHVVPLPELATSTLPAADAARRLFGPAGARAITALALLSVLGLINASIMSAPRVLYGLARDGLMPAAAALTRVNSGGTPVTGLLITSAFAALLTWAGNFPSLLAVSAILFVSLYTSGFVSLLVLRQREPDLERPFGAWGQPWIALAVVAASLAFLTGSVLGDPGNSLAALLLAALALPLRALARSGGDPEPAGEAGGP